MNIFISSRYNYKKLLKRYLKFDVTRNDQLFFDYIEKQLKLMEIKSVEERRRSWCLSKAIVLAEFGDPLGMRYLCFSSSFEGGGTLKMCVAKYGPGRKHRSSTLDPPTRQSELLTSICYVQRHLRIICRW